MSQDITVLRSAYRRLLRHAYRAVLFSVPGRYQVRDRLRLRFRGPSDEPARNRFRLGPAMSGETPRGTLDMAKVENTIDFLKRATETTGMEHKILKNLVWVWWGQQDVNYRGRVNLDRQAQKLAYARVEETLEELNESLGTGI